MAFRALMTVSREEATPFIGTPACSEYLQGIDNWIEDQRKLEASQKRIDELNEECAWLRS
jgi:hypothetical protein